MTFFIDSQILIKIDDNVKEGYVVWNDNCKIPNISAHDKSIKHLIKKNNSPKCSSKLPLTSVVLDVNTWSYTFKINDNFKSLIFNSRIINCCYSSIVRNELKFKNNSKDDDRYT